MYFKKAIDDATSDWAQHHAKRLIDTKAKASVACLSARVSFCGVFLAWIMPTWAN